MADNSTIDYIVGLPPDDMISQTNTVMRNSMPLARIYPGIPSFTKGLSLFTRKPAFETSTGKGKSEGYHTMLKQHGFDINQPSGNNGDSGCLVVAYQADSFPTDSFTNEYGENFLQKMTETVSQGAAEFSQMFGGRSISEVASKMKGTLDEGSGVEKMLGSLLGGVQKAGKGAGDFLSKLPGIGGTLETSGSLINTLMAGGRIDFPLTWKTSGFQPSYTMTIRLYNPNPGSNESTRKYIAAPIAALMLLGIPISSDGATYSWPFIHRIWSPGIYDLDPAFISNITVIKGGDQQQISFKQKLGVVDVRIDFGSLFSTIVATKGMAGKKRPSLANYIDAIAGPNSEKTGVKNFSTFPVGPGRVYDESERQGLGRDVSKTQIVETKKQAPTVEEPTQEEIQNPSSRVPVDIQSTSKDLESKMPSGL